MKLLPLSFITLFTLSLIACGGSTNTKDDDDFFVPPSEDSSNEEGNSNTTSDGDFPVPPVEGNVSDDIFDRERLIQVYLKMPEDDFAQLRTEGRPLSVAMDICPSTDFEYTDFKATANIDGEVLKNVAIRKKGYLGSLSHQRPSLKLNFDTHEEGRKFKTLKRMTLNNDRQDPSHTHQCMSYDLYRAAGLIAPRCNLAHVVINNEDMGVYSHVESIKKPFLKRYYNDKSGNLYEAQIADIGSHLNQRFELKTNKTANDRSDLDQLAQVLSLEDSEFLDQLPQHIDLEEFITYWAVETLIGHWDSATGNTNNYYMYHNPSDGLFHFIPWGTDSAFTSQNIFKPNSDPLYKNLSIAKRLYDIEETRTKYFSAINKLLTEVWNEDALLDNLEKVQLLTGTPVENFQEMKTFISGDSSNNTLSQRENLQKALAGERSHTSYLLPNEEFDCDQGSETSSLTASFESSDIGGSGQFSFTDAQGKQYTASMTIVSSFTETNALAYMEETSTIPSVINLTLIGASTPPFYTESFVLQVFIEKPSYQKGSIKLQALANNIMLFKVIDKDATPPVLELISAGHSGSIELEETGLGGPSSPIKGTINAEMGKVNTPNYSVTYYDADK